MKDLDNQPTPSRPITIGRIFRRRWAVPSTLAAVSGPFLALLGMSVAQQAVADEAPADRSSTLTEPKRQWTAGVRWENDAFGGTDKFYTDGVALGVSHTGPSWMDPAGNFLPWGEGRRTVTYDVAQAMFTPSNKDLNPPDPTDRPYAGILAFGLTLHVEKTNSYHGLKFVTGVVGPASGAKETQDAVHELIGNGKSQGWDYQLHNEPIFNFAYEYRHRFQLVGEREGWSAEALPIGGGWLGNMLIQAQGGALLRAGYHMPNDFGPSLVRDMGFMPPPRRDPSSRSSDWGFSVYAGAFGNLVLRDISLDGNTFQDSPSVDKKYFVPMATVGASVGNRRFQASFSYIFLGQEFEGQDQREKFGTICFSYLF
ncbi:MAG TPA: lipid A deacylase LpxR family protein [Verrucomicrobiae bacterium]